jgi:hypothetical protein
MRELTMDFDLLLETVDSATRKGFFRQRRIFEPNRTVSAAGLGEGSGRLRRCGTGNGCSR